jgi:hypothetical protein
MRQRQLVFVKLPVQEKRDAAANGRAEQRSQRA